MTNRERFHEVLNYGSPDRLPYFEEGLREDVLKEWFKQGLSPDLAEFSDFNTDHFEQLLPEIEPIPEYKNWPVKSEDLVDLSKRLNENDPKRLPPHWQIECKRWVKNDHVIFLRIQRGFFQTLGVYNWNRFNELMSLLVENPMFIEQYMEIYTQFILRLTRRILKSVNIDAVVFSEPIGSNEGPLISPEMYQQFALKYYKKIIDAFVASGISTIIFRTYANARTLIPLILEYGFNCLWACETNIEAMDYLSIRREFGTDLRLIGGIDLDTLRTDKETIRCEIDRLLPVLLSQGGYIPLADGRVRPDISLENYLFYRNYLQEIIQKLR